MIVLAPLTDLAFLLPGLFRVTTRRDIFGVQGSPMIVLFSFAFIDRTWLNQDLFARWL
jgi:hypothetical protein